MGKGCCDEESCSSEKSCCESSCESGDSCSDENKNPSGMMMKLAEDAWSELMKEKIKAVFEKETGSMMNKVAQATAEASIAYWTHKMEGEAKCHEHQEKIMKAFMG